jgi:putative pyruvate formate lyase activating enzyme
VVPFILEALEIAVGKGLQLPIVYNSGGYDSMETLELLDGIVDIYMPDMKYSEGKVGEKFSGVKGYPQVNRAAVKEMHRQVGDLQVDESGVATRGLLVRHLVLPNGLAGTESVVKFLAEEISANTYLNVMAQYHPCYHAFEHPQISRPITNEEYSAAIELAQRYGLYRLDERVSLPLRLIHW